MSTQVVLIIVGVGFIAVGVAGGGTFFQLEIPKLPKPARIMAATVGVAIFAFAFFPALYTANGQADGTASPPVSQTPLQSPSSGGPTVPASPPTTVIGAASPTPSQPSRFSINVACHDNTATVMGRFPEQYVGTEIDFVFNGILPATNRITSLAPKLSFQKQFQIARFLNNSHRLLVVVTDPQSHDLARQQVDCS
jgi:hypothetical protein